jgi:hypothetical protein
MPGTEALRTSISSNPVNITSADLRKASNVSQMSGIETGAPNAGAAGSLDGLEGHVPHMICKCSPRRFITPDPPPSTFTCQIEPLHSKLAVTWDCLLTTSLIFQSSRPEKFRCCCCCRRRYRLPYRYCGIVGQVGRCQWTFALAKSRSDPGALGRRYSHGSVSQHPRRARLAGSAASLRQAPTGENRTGRCEVSPHQRGADPAAPGAPKCSHPGFRRICPPLHASLGTWCVLEHYQLQRRPLRTSQPVPIPSYNVLWNRLRRGQVPQSSGLHKPEDCKEILLSEDKGE